MKPSKTSLIAPGASDAGKDRPQSGALSAHSRGSQMKPNAEDLKREREEALSNYSKKKKSDPPSYREGYETEIRRLEHKSFKKDLYEIMEEIMYGATIEKLTGKYHQPKWYNEDEVDKNVPI